MQGEIYQQNTGQAIFCICMDTTQRALTFSIIFLFRGITLTFKNTYKNIPWLVAVVLKLLM